MNTPDDLDLLRRLKQLPREREPASDLWAGIEARLQPAAAPRRRSWLPYALAASAVLAAVLWLQGPPTPALTVVAAPAAPAAPPPANEFVRREAEAITIEYRLALETFAGATLPPELEVAATELDVSARSIRRALRDDPDAVYLLDRLRRTYDQRLKLTQRVLVG